MIKQSTHTNSAQIGWWTPGNSLPQSGLTAIQAAIRQVTRPIFVVGRNNDIAVVHNGTAAIGAENPTGTDDLPLYGFVPALHPMDLGDPFFKKRHNLRYAYVVGAMANGITSAEMVEAAGRAGMIGFFGAAGLLPQDVEAAIDQLQNRLENIPFGFNLIHTPFDPAIETAVVDLYLKRNIRLVSASAYLGLTLPLVHYRVSGIYRDPDDNVVCPNKIIAKVSRIEIARKFLSPPPQKILQQLVDQKLISSLEAELAAMIPMADDLTAEADSGGHTDNRPAITLLPTMLALRDEMAPKYNYPMPPGIGLGGGIATPDATAAAFAMGAAYVLTGTVNQACKEAGTSETVRRMLAEASQADVTMAPAADMFEMGIKVQVLKRGTMFPLRAAKLYELYVKHDRFEDIPEKQRQILERNFFRCSFQQEWEQTQRFFNQRDPSQVERAVKDQKHKMALVFRSYLGQSSNWANSGDPSRKIDYQIWCGPAIGAFNQWVHGSFLEKPENRTTVTVAKNLLLGAAVATRFNWLCNQGIALPPVFGKYSPLEMSQISGLLKD
jgi:PfaD family protein